MRAVVDLAQPARVDVAVHLRRRERAVTEQLDLAASHCRTAASHLRAREVPRGAAHAWAAHGHVRTADGLLEEQARMHARKSNP